MFAISLLIIHGLIAFALLGAITHQAVAVAVPARGGRSTSAFICSLRGVGAITYTNAIVVLYVLSAGVGLVLYPEYRIHSRETIEHTLRAGSNAFEFKEHFVAIGLGLLPAYWYYWRAVPLDDERVTRAALTLLLAAIVWWSFLVGHVVNNVKGIGL